MRTGLIAGATVALLAAIPITAARSIHSGNDHLASPNANGAR